jgi:hypothetical protein
LPYCCGRTQSEVELGRPDGERRKRRHGALLCRGTADAAVLPQGDLRQGTVAIAAKKGIEHRCLFTPLAGHGHETIPI